MTTKCKLHNLQQDTICMGQVCHKRISCQLCIRKHDHKFYLDTKTKQQKIGRVQEQLDEKLVNLKKYIKSNIMALKLQKYRESIQQTFQQEELYFRTKIREQKQNFLLWMQRTEKTFTDTITELRCSVLRNYEGYYQKSLHHLSTQNEYQQLRQFFKGGNWAENQFIQKSVNFLYSQEVLFKFNRNMDTLKRVIHFNKKQNAFVFTWVNLIRDKFPDLDLCPQHTFKEFIQQYKLKPKIQDCDFPQTKQARDDDQSVFAMIGEDKKALLLYPKQIYQPHQHVQKLRRLNNMMFCTTGARSLNIWSKVNLQMQKSYQMDYTTYALSTFIQQEEQDSDVILFGKSNGQIGHLNILSQKISYVKGHQAAIRDILQFDQYHFLTGSQDWLIKVWGMSEKGQKQFAKQRAVLKGHSGRVHILCKFGPNVLGAGADGTIKLWDIQSQSFDQVFQHQKQIYTLTEIRPELFLSGGQLNQIRLFDYRVPKSPGIKFPVQFCCNSSIRYNQSSFIFADRNVVKLVDIRNPKQPSLRYENKDTYSHSINSMEFLSDIEIGMGGSDNVITLWKY